MLTVDDTGSITPEAVQDERDSGMDESMVQQEFYCSFEASLIGAYYAQQMADALEAGRIGNVAHDPAVAVDTFWDLGWADLTAIWFRQTVGQEQHLIDYYEASGEPLAHYAGILQAKAMEHGYKFGTHVLPHDADATELGTGKSRRETLKALHIESKIAPKLPVADGIDAARNLLPRCWFDATRCERGIQALRSYRKEEDPLRSDGTVTFFKERPCHDWASHAADAFRYSAVWTPSKRRTGPLNLPKLPIV